MALIAMAVYCTEENKKDEYLDYVLRQLKRSLEPGMHDLYLCVNGATAQTDEILDWYSSPCIEGITAKVIRNEQNIGTARAINKAWALRKPGQHCVKMDDDIVINSETWIEDLESAILRDPTIGQIGLKRKDCWEWPGHEHDDWRSELHMLPHKPGEPWQIVEKVKHVIGSCVMHNAALLDKVGYLYQPSLYGYDDVIMSHRTHLAGFYSCFLPHINIDHIDPGDTPYQGWKERHSAERTQEVIDLVREMYNGTKPIYYNAE
jgi:GT2 family glycosyltransferase